MVLGYGAGTVVRLFGTRTCRMWCVVSKVVSIRKLGGGYRIFCKGAKISVGTDFLPCQHHIFLQSLFFGTVLAARNKVTLLGYAGTRKRMTFVDTTAIAYGQKSAGAS